MSKVLFTSHLPVLALLPLTWLPKYSPTPSQMWQPGHLTGSIMHRALNEASGLAIVKTMPDVLWSHNDSGDRPRLFALNKKGELIATVEMKGVPAYDIEDIAAGPCAPKSDKQCIFVADIGDNRHKRNMVRIYRFGAPTQIDKALMVESIDYIIYPNGAHDAETLLIHPTSAHQYIVQKSRRGATHIFRIPEGPSTMKTPKMVVEVAKIRPQSTNLGGKLITAGDISPDGRCVALRTYTHIETYCAKSTDAFLRAFDHKPDRIQTPPMLQSEALAYDPNTHGLWITSERWPAPLMYHSPRKKR